MQSYPENGLALEDLLRCAAEHHVTAALDLRSDLAAGRIDIVRGQVVDAVFGGLACEEAIHAALNSPSLRVLRGRTPRLSSPRRVPSSTLQIVREWKSRWQEAAASNKERGRRPKRTNGGVQRHVKGQFLWQRFLFYVVAAVVAASTFALGRSHGKWLRVGVNQSVVAPSSRANSGCWESTAQLPPGEVIRVTADAAGVAQHARRVDVLVDDAGRAVGAKFEHSGPETRDTEDATLEALYQVHFEPARCNGANMPSWANVRVELVSPESSTAPLARL
ncbi:MAG TPA: hypothetical protein VKP30_32995 [Polyangiaceae bacterium]|nr:hypothetical protein [Polyangiaceae bacterium]